MSKVYSALALTLFFSITFIRSLAQPSIAFDPKVTAGLVEAVDIVNAGDGSDRIFVVQRGGTINVYDAAFAPVGTGIFLSIPDSIRVIGGEEGLLSLAFDPDYESNGFFYVYYVNPDGDVELSRYSVTGDPNVADPESGVVVLTIPHPGQENHNGGKLNFGLDGFLYFATGDGGGSGDVFNNAQNGMLLLGKMIRIDVNGSATAPYYDIPVTNPFTTIATDPTSTIRDEIYAFGLRNPFRWSFDILGNMWIGDVGQGSWEELNFRAVGTTGGVNYGWHCYEGSAPFNTTGCGGIGAYHFPFYEYPNTSGAAVTGGMVYRGTAYPTLLGYYFAADVYSGNIYITNTTTFTTTVQLSVQGAITAFGESEDGEMFVVTLGGEVLQLGPLATLPVTLVQFGATSRNGVVGLSWKTSSEQNVRQFEVEFGTDPASLRMIGSVPATNNPNGATYSYDHVIRNTRQAFYRLKMVDLDGTYTYSNILNVNVQTKQSEFVYPSVITNGIVSIFVNDDFDYVRIINSNGSVINQRQIKGVTGRVDIPLRSAVSGTYVVQLIGDARSVSQKVIVQ